MAKFPVANKNFGQHFLNSDHVIKKITNTLPASFDAIIEVGPGPAVLTPHLVAHGKPVFVIEMDRRFEPLLQAILPQENIFFNDALEFDWPEFLSKHRFEHIWLVSNLPYNVSVPLTLKFMRITQISTMSLMYQKEVAEKIHPRVQKNSMGSLCALLQTQFQIKSLVHAPPGSFVPPPKVESLVLYFERNLKPLIPLEQVDAFETFLRVIFANRRKQLQGLLRKEYGTEICQTLLSTTLISPEQRAESLNLQQVIELYATLVTHLH